MQPSARIAADAPLVPDLQARLRSDQVAARKATDKDRTLLLGTVLAALKNRELDNGGGALSDDDAVEVLRKQIKQRRDSIEQFTRGGRQDLADKETAEIVVLESYLPPAMDAGELEDAVDKAIASTGAASAKDTGKVMKAVMAALVGRTVDGKTVNEMVRRKLQP
jgi:uncharacterized protein YqeY